MHITYLNHGDNIDFVPLLKNGSIHYVSVAMPGLTIACHNIECAGGFDCRQRNDFMMTINRAKETGTLYPKVNITILPSPSASYGGIDLTIYNDGDYSDEEVIGHILDAFKANSAYIKSRTLYFDFRDLCVSEFHYVSCLKIAVSRLNANQLEIFTWSETITSEDIEKIVSIGQTELSGLPPEKSLMAVYGVHSFIAGSDWQTWARKTKDLSDIKLIQLFMGLIVLEREGSGGGTSVSGAISVYATIRKRHLDNGHKLAKWAMLNCDNQYIPFGWSRSRYRKSTTADYDIYQAKNSASGMTSSERHEAVQKRVVGRKEKRTKAIAVLRKLSKETRSQIRAKLLEQYSTASTQEKLETIAKDEQYPPEYYPTEWACISPSEIEKLPIALIKKLCDRLTTKTRGEWKRFAMALRQYDDGI